MLKAFVMDVIAISSSESVQLPVLQVGGDSLLRNV